MSKGNQSAYPVTGMQVGVVKGGLTKREYIASQCLAALLSTLTIERDAHSKYLAETAVMHADALLAELSKNQE